jgi:carbon monoxide dehydrogenase subunit G
MDLSDEIRIPAPRARVYEALQDPEILRACIPGCEELVKLSDTELEAKVVLKIGPVKARFAGRVTLNPENPPQTFSLSGEGSGGVAGFAKGGAVVTLEDLGDETLLRYDAKAEIGGKLAQLGSRLIQGTAKKLAGNFFETFQQTLTEETAAT